MIPSSLNRNVLAFRSQIRPLRLALRFGRDHPVTFSAIFFTSSSIGIAVLSLFGLVRSGRAGVHRPALAQVLHEMR